MKTLIATLALLLSQTLMAEETLRDEIEDFCLDEDGLFWENQDGTFGCDFIDTGDMAVCLEWYGCEYIDAEDVPSRATLRKVREIGSFTRVKHSSLKTRCGAYIRRGVTVRDHRRGLTRARVCNQAKRSVALRSAVTGLTGSIRLR